MRVQKVEEGGGRGKKVTWVNMARESKDLFVLTNPRGKKIKWEKI